MRPSRGVDRILFSISLDSKKPGLLELFFILGDTRGLALLLSFVEKIK